MVNSKFKIGDVVMYNAPTDDATPFNVSEIAINFNAIPENNIHPYTVDVDAYSESELNKPWYKDENEEEWYAEDELTKVN